MQDAEDIVFEGLKLFNKILEKPEPEPEEPDMGGGGEQPQQEQMQAQEVEPDHVDHESHWSWSHNSTQALVGGVIGTVGLVLVAWLGYKSAKRPKD